MPRRVALHGASDEALALLPDLAARPDVVLVAVADRDPDRVRARLRAGPPALAALAEPLLCHSALLGQQLARIDLLIGETPRGDDSLPGDVWRLSPRAARLLLIDAPRRDPAPLLRSLSEIAAATELLESEADVARLLLDAALGATPAERGSLLCVDEGQRQLRLVASRGLERELWAKIRVPFGSGIAGNVAAKQRGLRLRGPCDPQRFRGSEPRCDVADALVLPLLEGGRLVGVLTLHHRSRRDVFDAVATGTAQRIAAASAGILARAVERRSESAAVLRSAGLPELRRALTGEPPLPERLARACALLARRWSGGAAHIQHWDPSERALRLVAHSHASGNGGAPLLATPLGHGLEGGVAARRHPLVLRSPDSRFAWGAWPLLSATALLGVLCVEGRPPGGEDDPLLPEAAGLIADAIERSRAAEAAGRSETLAERGHSLLLAILGSGDDAGRARALAEGAASLVDAEHAVLRIAEGDALRVRAYVGSFPDADVPALLEIDQRAARGALRARGPTRLPHLGGAPRLGIRSVLTTALRAGERTVGVLTLYDKRTPDGFEAGEFDDLDAGAVRRLTELAAHALALPATDAATPVARPAVHLAEALDEALARAEAEGTPVALVSCRVANHRELEDAAPGSLEGVLTRVRAALEQTLRAPERCERAGAAGFRILLPQPGDGADDRFTALTHSLTTRLGLDVDDDSAPRPTLVFGYAVYPEDAGDRAGLLEAAALPRIRIV